MLAITVATVQRQQIAHKLQRILNILQLDATHSAVLLQQVVRPSVCDVEVSWSHRLEYFLNNFMAD